MTSPHLYSIKVPAQKLCLAPDLQVLEINLLELIDIEQRDRVKSVFLPSTKRFQYSIYINDTEKTIYEGVLVQTDIILPITFSYTNPLPQCFVIYTLTVPDIQLRTQGHFFAPLVHTNTSHVSLQMTPQQMCMNGEEDEDEDEDEDDGDGDEDGDADDADDDDEDGDADDDDDGDADDDDEDGDGDADGAEDDADGPEDDADDVEDDADDASNADEDVDADAQSNTILHIDKLLNREEHATNKKGKSKCRVTR